MTNSKTQNKRQMACRKAILLLTVLSLVCSLLGLPLYAQTAVLNSPAGRVVDGIQRGARDIGRGARDLIDPDHNGGMTDGGDLSDNNHSSGHVTDRVTGPIPDSGTSDGMIDEIMPDSPVTEGVESMPSPDGGNGSVTDHTAENPSRPSPDDTAPATTASDAPETTGAPETTDGNPADGSENGGFRWTGLIIAIIVAVAVIVLIWLLIPKKKNR